MTAVRYDINQEPTPVFGVPHSRSKEYMALPVLVTPEMCQYWMDHCNEGNRHLKPAHIARYSTALRGNRWKRDGNTIAFDHNGRMINGQNRCMAVIDSGVSVVMLVAVNCDPDGFATTDTGVGRSAADILSILDPTRTYHREIATLTRMIWAYENGQPKSKSALAHEDLIEIYEREGDSMRVACEQANNVYPKLKGSKAGLAFSFWMINQVDSAAARVFFTTWAEALDFWQGGPIQILTRHWTLNARDTAVERAAIIIKGYNLWATGTTREHLTWRSVEKFPEPVRRTYFGLGKRT